jgi:hypothetical protein
VANTAGVFIQGNIVSPKPKIAVTLIGTLLIGIVIGALGLATWEQTHRDQMFREMMTEEGIIRHLERDLQMEDAQRAQVRQIIAPYAAEIAGLTGRHLADMSETMDSLMADLSTVLTEEQMADMLAFHHKMEEMRLKGLSEPNEDGR